MQASTRINLDIHVESFAWMSIANPAMTVDEAVHKLRSLGNVILEVDAEGRRVKCHHYNGFLEEAVYACEGCGAYSKNPATTQEHEAICEKVKRA